MEDIQKATLADPGSGQNISVGGGTYRVIISGRETGGEYAVIDMLVPPNGGPGPHAHPGVQESFYVVAGEVEFKTAQGTYLARAGSFVNIPKGGMVHFFKNKSDSLAHLLCTVMPAGMEDFFLEIGRPVAFGEFLPPAPMTDEAMKKLVSIGERYGQQFFPPDHLDK